MVAPVLVLAVPLLALALVRLLDGATARSRGRERLVGWLRETKLWHVLVAIALSAFLFASIFNDGPGQATPLLFALMVVVLLAIRAWRYEFLLLMSLSDEEFPGRNDKLIWAAALLIVPPIGVWLFRSYRAARWPEPASLKPSAAPHAI